MTTHETQFDIGEAVDFSGRASNVRGITIGSDRAVYYTVEYAVAQSDDGTTYASATVAASAVRPILPPQPEEPPVVEPTE